MLDLPLCQERQEEIRRFNMCFFLKTNTRVMMNESRSSRVVVVTTSSFIV